MILIFCKLCHLQIHMAFRVPDAPEDETLVSSGKSVLLNHPQNCKIGKLKIFILSN